MPEPESISTILISIGITFYAAGVLVILGGVVRCRGVERASLRRWYLLVAARSAYCLVAAGILMFLLGMLLR